MQSGRELLVVFAVQGDGRQQLLPSWEQAGAGPGTVPTLARVAWQSRTRPLCFQSQENTGTSLSFKSLSPVLHF